MDSNLMRQMQEMQRRADELQKGLAAMEAEGVSGGGLVRATLNGLSSRYDNQMKSALPFTFSTGTEPHTRPSFELSRLSPIAKM